VCGWLAFPFLIKNFPGISHNIGFALETLAKQIPIDKHPDKIINVFDIRISSAHMTNVLLFRNPFYCALRSPSMAGWML
jgi:hypothetical protein